MLSWGASEGPPAQAKAQDNGKSRNQRYRSSQRGFGQLFFLSSESLFGAQ
jgi:hypothetical protein